VCVYVCMYGGTHGGGERCLQGFSREVRDHWEDLGIDGPWRDRDRWGELDSAGSG
jgi:hypothetical protein